MGYEAICNKNEEENSEDYYFRVFLGDDTVNHDYKPALFVVSFLKDLEQANL